jgi:hypothetical protein
MLINAEDPCQYTYLRNLKTETLIGITNFFFFGGPILWYRKFSDIYPENKSKLTLEKNSKIFDRKENIGDHYFLIF